MRLIVTGGGTGGHVYPALEVARAAALKGAEVRYFGSERGQEGKACQAANLPFLAFPAAPLYSLRTPRGWKSLAGLIRASQAATAALRKAPADVVFSTGGYSAAPVLWAARRTRTKIVLFEANSVPGRTTRMFVPDSVAQAYVFRTTRHFEGPKARRTGLPIRQSLRQATSGRNPESNLVLVMGGSQGSAFLNERVPLAAKELPDARFLHVAGRAHAETTQSRVDQIGLGERYQVVPYLDGEAIETALQRATVAVARSGGTLSEFAAFRLPSVLIPLPSSADDHQKVNALEFVEMDAATLCEQPSHDLTAAISGWLDAPDRREAAAQALAEWDTPNSTDQVVTMIFEAIR